MTSSIKVSLFAALVLVASFVAVSPAFAAVNIDTSNGVTLVNGKTSDSVDAGEEFDVTIQFDATSGDEVEFVRSRVRDQEGQVIYSACENVGRKTGNDVALTVEVGTPSDTPQGNVDVLIALFGQPGVSQNDGCSGSDLASVTIEDRVRVGDNTNVGHSSSSNVGSSLSQWQMILEALKAIATKLDAPQAPTKPGYCAQRGNFTAWFGQSGPNVAAYQQFLISSGFSIPAGATGYFGVQTQAASTAMAAQCL